MQATQAQMPAAQKGGILEDSNIDPFDCMDRGTFKKYVKAHAPHLLKPGMVRDTVTNADGTTEQVGVKEALRSMGLNGTEPIPLGTRAESKPDPEAAETFREATVQASQRMQNEQRTKVEALKMPQLRKMAKNMGLKQGPRDKKQKLQQMILEAAG